MHFKTGKEHKIMFKLDLAKLMNKIGSFRVTPIKSASREEDATMSSDLVCPLIC